MATMIPSISLTQFKKLKAPELKRLKSCEVTFNGDYVFTFVNGATESSGYLRTQAEYVCEMGNSVGGQDLEEILKETILAGR